VYTPARKEHLNIENYLKREFSPIMPNQVWCGDVTYLWTWDKWTYLVTILALYGRKIIDFVLSDLPDSELTKRTLSNAFEARERPNDIMLHSDQGFHYTNIAFRQLI
jgi:putative transposase